MYPRPPRFLNPPFRPLMKTPRLLAAFLFSTLVIPFSLSAAEKSKVDPQALARLKQMSNTLSSAKSFTYSTKNIVEVAAATGQFLTLFSTSDVALQRPDKLSARMRGEAPSYNFYYDGQTVSAFSPGTNVYSQAKAPATIDAMLPDLESETGLRFATTPLLLSDPYAAMTAGLSSAVIIGPSTVHGTECQHLAFRAPGINWEIWLESNNRALPRRLAVTFTDRTNFPRTIVEFSNWNLRPWLSAGKFTFRPPADARQIPFISVLKSSGR